MAPVLAPEGEPTGRKSLEAMLVQALQSLLAKKDNEATVINRALRASAIHTHYFPGIEQLLEDLPALRKRYAEITRLLGKYNAATDMPPSSQRALRHVGETIKRMETDLETARKESYPDLYYRRDTAASALHSLDRIEEIYILPKIKLMGRLARLLMQPQRLLKTLEYLAFYSKEFYHKDEKKVHSLERSYNCLVFSLENWDVELPENAQNSLRFVKFIVGNMKREVKTPESGPNLLYRNPVITSFATGLVKLVERDFLHPKINEAREAINADGEAYLSLKRQESI